jgi:hypothetical protein
MHLGRAKSSFPRIGASVHSQNTRLFIPPAYPFCQYRTLCSSIYKLTSDNRVEEQVQYMRSAGNWNVHGAIRRARTVCVLLSQQGQGLGVQCNLVLSACISVLPMYYVPHSGCSPRIYDEYCFNITKCLWLWVLFPLKRICEYCFKEFTFVGQPNNLPLELLCKA